MEVQLTDEVAKLRLHAGAEFHGEGILAITKALLQSGVAYVGGYEGAPVSHLLDVMVQAEPYLRELGVHVEACSKEAAAAAMLGASLHYPVRGAVTWKSIRCCKTQGHPEVEVESALCRSLPLFARPMQTVNRLPDQRNARSPAPNLGTSGGPAHGPPGSLELC